MTNRKTALAAGLCLAGIISVSSGAAAQEADCGGYDEPIVFGGLDYDSAAFHTAMARFVLENAYGCETDTIPGATLVLNQGLARGDVDILMEVWTANTAQAFLDAEADGKVERLGATFPDATEGWYVPRYLVEGEGAAAPDLTSATQLADYKELFEDAEEPDKGRFYNCVAGWVCEGINTKKLIAYGLEDDYTNVRPGSGAAIEAAVESAYLREKPVLFYHWAPTALLGKYDFVKLDEPEYDEATWQAMLEAEEPDAATAYPMTRVVIGANTEFTSGAGDVREFLLNYSTSAAQTGTALAYMKDNGATAEEAAVYFLEENAEVWQAWMDEAAAKRLASAL